MILIFVTLDVSNCGTSVSLEQMLNMLLISVTLEVSPYCQHPSNEFAVLSRHFPPASKKAFIEGICFSMLFVTATFLFPKYNAISPPPNGHGSSRFR